MKAHQVYADTLRLGPREIANDSSGLSVNDRETEPEILDWDEPDTRTMREKLADRLEDFGCAFAMRYWAIVRRVRGRA